MLCERCKKNEGCIHIVEENEKEKIEHVYCQSCLDELLKGLKGYIREITDKETKEVKKTSKRKTKKEKEKESQCDDVEKKKTRRKKSEIQDKGNTNTKDLKKTYDAFNMLSLNDYESVINNFVSDLKDKIEKIPKKVEEIENKKNIENIDEIIGDYIKRTAEILGIKENDLKQGKASKKAMEKEIIRKKLEREKTRKCPMCNSTYKDVIISRKVGCSECYKYFRRDINNFFYERGQSLEYLGKWPDSFMDKTEGMVKRESITGKINILKLKLKEVLEVEDFTSAAKIRDEINSLKEKIKKIESGENYDTCK